MASLADEMTAAARESGKSTRKIAEEMCCSYSRVGRWLRGERNYPPRPADLHRFLKVVGASRARRLAVVAAFHGCGTTEDFFERIGLRSVSAPVVLVPARLT
jgi:transcriptional regulator with XRE-family HTH domain